MTQFLDALGWIAVGFAAAMGICTAADLVLKMWSP